MLEYLLTNQAPDADACTVRVFSSLENEVSNGDDHVSITIWREEDQSVHIKIDDNDGNCTDLELGKESITTKM